MIQIDIDADPNMVDDEDRNVARLPADSSRINVVGRPGFWSWVLVGEIAEDSVFFHQISSSEAASHGEFAVRSTA